MYDLYICIDIYVSLDIYIYINIFYVWNYIYLFHLSELIAGDKVINILYKFNGLYI